MLKADFPFDFAQSRLFGNDNKKSNRNGNDLCGWDLGFIPTYATPGTYLSSSGLWIGLAFTAVCLAAAVRLRRYRTPV